MRNSQDQTLDSRKLAKLGYIKFDTNTGLAENGKTICLITDEEKFILTTIRNAFGGALPKKYSLELKINKLDPLIFSFKK